MRRRRSVEDLDVVPSCVEGAEKRSSAMSKMLNIEVQLSRWTPKHPVVDRPARQTSTLCRLTPARYRFSAAATDSADHASIEFDPCLSINRAGLSSSFLKQMHRRPIASREVLSRPGENVHLLLRHLSRTCRIPRKCTGLLVRSTASLQRFAAGSDATHH